jgi:hypothetical protein
MTLSEKKKLIAATLVERGASEGFAALVIVSCHNDHYADMMLDALGFDASRTPLQSPDASGSPGTP